MHHYAVCVHVRVCVWVCVCVHVCCTRVCVHVYVHVHVCMTLYMKKHRAELSTILSLFTLTSREYTLLVWHTILGFSTQGEP